MSWAQVTVCIATHKRCSGLAKLLGSLVAQQGAPPFDVIVVDNDKEKSAEAVALEFRDKLQLTYLVEPVRGIARTRNRAIASSRSPFLAFIDDDEWALPGWLTAFDRARSSYHADALVGPVEIEFDPEVSELVRNCGLFGAMRPAQKPSAGNRHVRGLPPEGVELRWYYGATSNAYVRRDALPDREAPFSTRFDLIGGSDVDLFKRMIDAGSRLMACSNAVVVEHRPLARANFAWILRRALRNGVQYAEFTWPSMPLPMRLGRGLRCGYAGSKKWLQAGRVWRGDRSAAGRHVVAGGAEVGKLLYALGIQIHEYRHHP